MSLRQKLESLVPMGRREHRLVRLDDVLAVVEEHEASSCQAGAMTHPLEQIRELLAEIRTQVNRGHEHSFVVANRAFEEIDDIAVESLTLLDAMQREDVVLIRDVLEREYFGDWNRAQATHLARLVAMALGSRKAPTTETDRSE